MHCVEMTYSHFDTTLAFDRRTEILYRESVSWHAIITRNSAIADKPRDAFGGQSRSPNMVPFDVLCMVSN